MHQITWFWPPKLKNLPTVGAHPAPLGPFAPSGLVAPLPRICSQNISVFFLKSEIIPPPPHFWRPVYATGCMNY